MQHDITTNKRYAEMTARLALLACGWKVHTSDTDEAYDILATDTVNGDHVRIQVLTICERFNRGGELVVYAIKANGEAYTRFDCDYIIGVLADNGERPLVFMFENRELSEYWSSGTRAAERWLELSITLDRALLAGIASA